MLFYLDNWLSVGPSSAKALGIPAHPGRYPPRRPGKRTSGLNENYGRELLELHTLSVNGGYSQRDVTEVAKVFTGWTIENPAQGGGFKFDPRMHEPGSKFVLGHKIKPKGESEGMEVLHRLATSPQTAHFISLKLAERFVSDDPPSVFSRSDGKSVSEEEGRHRRSAEHVVPFARVLGRAHLPRESENTSGIRGLRDTSHGQPRLTMRNLWSGN